MLAALAALAAQSSTAARWLFALAIVAWVIAIVLYLVKPKGPAIAPLFVVLGLIAVALGWIWAV